MPKQVQFTKEVIIKAAGKIVSDYLASAVNYEPAFKEFGLRLVRFSKEEPNLFHYLFLDKNGSTEYAL